jgi:dihydrolipoamide dehydrogenase
MSAQRDETQLAVIGAGPGGYAAAFMAADLGLEVALIDPQADPGGVCLFRGCIPSKALLHAAAVIGAARSAADMGIDFDAPRVDIDKLRGWKDGVVRKLTRGLGQLAKRRRVRFIRGRARFAGERELELEADDGPARLAFDRAILATGSRPTTIPGLPADSERVLDSAAALELAQLPERLLVVGGGYIGLELGTVYARLGSRVTLVEMTGSLLPGVDADLVRPLAKELRALFSAIHLETELAGLEDTGTAVRAELAGARVEGDGGQEFDRVLVAVGRRPNSAELGLERAGVEVDERGFVPVDEKLRTSAAGIQAIGDVTGQPMLAHRASHQGRIAAEVCAGRQVVHQPRAVPAVVFTQPEIAWCGPTETEAERAGRDLEPVRFPWAASGRAATMDAPAGQTKLLVDPSSGRVVGAGLVGAGAGELIAEAVLAIEMGATPEDLALAIHPHPTLSETWMEAAAAFHGTATHIYKPR